MKVISKINGYQGSSRGGINTHIVSSIVQELCSSITLHIMRVIITPSQLYIYPILLCCRAVHCIPAVMRGGAHTATVNTVILTCYQPAVMDETHSICKRQIIRCLHMSCSSCRTCEDEWSPFVPSQSPVHPTLDQIPTPYNTLIIAQWVWLIT